MNKQERKGTGEWRQNAVFYMIAIKVDGIIDETMDPNDYLYDEETLDDPEEEDDLFGDDLFPFVRGNQK